MRKLPLPEQHGVVITGGINGSGQKGGTYGFDLSGLLGQYRKVFPVIKPGTVGIGALFFQGNKIRPQIALFKNPDRKLVLLANLAGYLVVKAAIPVAKQGIDLVFNDVIGEEGSPLLRGACVVDPPSAVRVEGIAAIEVNAVSLDPFFQKTISQIGEKRTERTLQEYNVLQYIPRKTQRASRVCSRNPSFLNFLAIIDVLCWNLSSEQLISCSHNMSTVEKHPVCQSK